MGFAEDKEEGNILPPEEEKDEDPLKWEKMFRAPIQNPPTELLTPDFTPASKFANDPTIMTTQNQNAMSSETTTAMKSEIRVVTFDLDNTIWKTSATISDANDALSEYLQDTFGIEERSEKRMGRLFKTSPDRYAGIDFAENGSTIVAAENDDADNNKDDADTAADAAGVHIQASFDNNNNKQGQGGGGQVTKKPVYLTLLRKDAIRSLMQETNDNNDDHDASSADLEKEVDAAFELWVEARCQSISRNFAPSAVPTLANLRSQLGYSSNDNGNDASSSSSRKVYVGAITDGNSNPDRVAELSGTFDFLIRAEDVGASKPDRRVYKAAVAALMAQLVQDGRNVEEFFLGESSSSSDEESGAAVDTYLKSNSRGVVVDDDDSKRRSSSPGWKDVEEEAVEAFSEAVGSWWVHVGDDFFKDVVAAKEFQMRTVWTRELIGGSDFNNNDSVKTGNNDDGGDSKKKERSVTDLVNDVSKSKDGILTMSIGESEFLTNSLHEEFSDAILDRFDDLSGLLTHWHKEGGGEQSTSVAAAVSPVDGYGDVGMDNAVVSDAKDLETSRAAATDDSVSESRQPVEDAPKEGDEVSPARKFCVFCGAKLPAVAKFCSSCGERQI